LRGRPFYPQWDHRPTGIQDFSAPGLLERNSKKGEMVGTHAAAIP